MLAKIPLDGEMVREQYIGNTHIYISDGSYREEPYGENINRVLEEASRASLKIILHHQAVPRQPDSSV